MISIEAALLSDMFDDEKRERLGLGVLRDYCGAGGNIAVVPRVVGR